MSPLPAVHGEWVCVLQPADDDLRVTSGRVTAEHHVAASRGLGRAR